MTDAEIDAELDELLERWVKTAYVRGIHGPWWGQMPEFCRELRAITLDDPA